MYQIVVVMLLMVVSAMAATSKPAPMEPSVIRTEIRVGKSMRPEDTQEINVRSNNGGFATIVVKKRDSKTASLVPRTSVVYNMQPTIAGTFSATRLQPVAGAAAPKWAPFQQTSLIHSYEDKQPTAYVPASYRFDTPKSNSDNELINSFINHISQLEQATGGRAASTRDFIKYYQPTNSVRSGASGENKRHDLLTMSRSQQSFLVPKPVFVTSEPVEFSASNNENAKTKRGRSLMKIGEDGIPIVEGIRVPDDEQDKHKTWRQGRVINGELYPYEPGYKPKKAVPLVGDYGQLLFVKGSGEERGRSIGPFTKSDNFKAPRSTGPFTIDDNRSASARSDTSAVASAESSKQLGSIGPFTVKDNSRMANSKLIDYIKTINDEESRRRDLFEARHTFKRDALFAEPDHQVKMQRRMLENAGDLTFASSKYYSKDTEPVKSSEADRSPVLEYAHPEFGAQAASADYTSTTARPKIQYYSSGAVNTPITLQKHEYFPQAPDRYMSSEYSYPSQFSYDAPNYGYKKVKEEQPFYMRLAEQMREGVQNGFAVVLKPIVEVGQKITKNLGFGRSINGGNDSSARELFGFAKTPEQLNSEISVGEDKVRVKRNDDVDNVDAAYGIGGPQLYKNDKHDDEAETQFIEEIDVSNNRGHLQGYGIKFDTNKQHERQRRSLNQDMDADYDVLGDALLQNVASDSVEHSQRFGDKIRALIQNTDWTNTQCAKRVFCQVMLQQSTDDVALMEKKMRKFLPM